MQPKNFRLLIHHHTQVWRDEEGGIRLPASPCGAWINALADHFGEIRLLMYETEQRQTFQNMRIHRPNVILHSLGPPGYMWDRLPRMARIRSVCREASALGDGLLVRGITPRQFTVWREVSLPCKAFLLVNKPAVYPWSFVKSIRDISGIWSVIISHYRLGEFKKISPEGLLLTNALSLIPLIRDRFGVNSHFVPTNTVHRSEFLPLASLAARKLGQPCRLLFCARVMRTKGIVETLEALALILKSKYDCYLDIIGPAAEGDSLEDFEAIAKDLGIASMVRFHGRIPYGDDLFRFYRNSDILLLPTYSEGFPRVIWEAAANGCLVITCSVGGIPDLWKHEEHGLLVPARDSAAVAEAVKRLVADEKLRERLRTNAYAHAYNYSVEACAEIMAATLGKNW